MWTLLHHFWNDVWPNIAASILWIPATMVHVTRSNKKHMRIVIGDAQEKAASGTD
jgi:hypothetical protein